MNRWETDAEAALRDLERIRVEPARVVETACDDLFDWSDWRTRVDGSLRNLIAAVTGSPVRTPYAVTFAGWHPRFDTVWIPRSNPSSAAAHWQAVDLQTARRLRALRAIAGASRVAAEIGAIAAAGCNPLGAIQAARRLRSAVEALLYALQIDPTASA